VGVAHRCPRGPPIGGPRSVVSAGFGRVVRRVEVRGGRLSSAAAQSCLRVLGVLCGASRSAAAASRRPPLSRVCEFKACCAARRGPRRPPIGGRRSVVSSSLGRVLVSDAPARN